MFSGQRVAAAVRVIVDVRSCSLRVEPLAHIPLGCAGALSKLSRRQRAGAGECPVETEPIAHDDQRGVECRADLIDGPEYEPHQFVGVDDGRLLDGGHCVLLRAGFLLLRT
jgi:hypothetical protein